MSLLVDLKFINGIRMRADFIVYFAGSMQLSERVGREEKITLTIFSVSPVTCLCLLMNIYEKMPPLHITLFMHATLLQDQNYYLCVHFIGSGRH